MKPALFSITVKVSLADITLNATLYQNYRMTYTTPDLISDVDGMHFHTQYELFFVGNEPLHIKTPEAELTFQNEAFCIPPFQNHVVKNRTNAYGFCFTLKENEEKHTAPSPISALFHNGLSPLIVTDDTFRDLSRLMDACQKSSPYVEEECAALLKLIILSLYEKNAHTASQKKQKVISDYFHIIDQFIAAHFDEDIDLSTIADALHLSTKQTSRIIRKNYHATLSELLNEKRLLVAADLLEKTDKSISEIASCLFSRSENYFFRLFRQKYGLSPLAYRKRVRAKENETP